MLKARLIQLYTVLAAAFRRVGVAIWGVLADDQTGRLDVSQVLYFVGVALVSYGAWLVYAPAGFLLPGALLVWWTMPSRPPFVMRTDTPEGRR